MGRLHLKVHYLLPFCIHLYHFNRKGTSFVGLYWNLGWWHLTLLKRKINMIICEKKSHVQITESPLKLSSCFFLRGSWHIQIWFCRSARFFYQMWRHFSLDDLDTQKVPGAQSVLPRPFLRPWLRLITLTSTLIILDITKTSTNIIVDTSSEVTVITITKRHWRQAKK